MKTFIVLCCVLAVASAAPSNFWKDWSLLSDAIDYVPPENAQSVKVKTAVETKPTSASPLDFWKDWSSISETLSAALDYVPPENAQPVNDKPASTSPLEFWKDWSSMSETLSAALDYVPPAKVEAAKTKPAVKAKPVVKANPASASPLGYGQDWGSISETLSAALNYVPPANAQAVKAKPGYPSGLYPGPAKSEALVPPVRASNGNEINSPVAEAAPVAPENVLDWKALIGMGGSALSKASDSLNDMMKGLQDALKNIDPSVKSDIGKVNNIVDHVCNKIVETGTESSTFSYYSPEGLKVTCDYINRVAKVIVDGLENPEVTQYYVDKLNAPTKALLEQVEIYSAQ